MAVSGMKKDIGEQMADLGTRLSAAAGLASMADKSVAELRAHIAENYVTKDALAELIEGTREIRTSISGVHQRLDRVLERMAEK